NGEVTHASYSAHGKVITEHRSRLDFDEGKERTVKIVYYKDGVLTHAFRFAKVGETAENHSKEWVTPTLVDWHMMKSNALSNVELRTKLDQYDFGQANCSVNDKNFPREIA